MKRLISEFGVSRLVLVMSLLLSMSAVQAADKATAKKGGLIGNSYASQMDQLDSTTLRITTRKKVAGDLDEVNKPGTTMYNALVAVQNGASARAAIEAKALGFEVFQVLGSRNLTSTQEKRNASGDMGDGVMESAFTFAPGHYTNDVELAIELTVKLVPGKMPTNPPQGYVDVNALLVQFGLADVVKK